MSRVILHSDLNSFYASVEELYHPEYANKPLVVCGSVDKRHGIILTKNQAAKRYKINTGEALWQAYKKCPNLIAIEPNYHKYLRFSKMVRAIYADYTDRIEAFGIDECWLDVSESTRLFGSGEKIADTIRDRIFKECGITASIGVSYNKIYAKLGSDLRKPNFTTLISLENKVQIVYPRPIDELLYVGPATKKKLLSYGILTIGDLAQANETFIYKLLGKMGLVIQSFARGEDQSEVMFADQNSPIKSIGNSLTPVRDLKNITDVKMLSYLLAESIASRLRDHNLLGEVVSVNLRDCELQSFTRQAKLNNYTDVSNIIANKAVELISENYAFNIPLRSMGISVSNLANNKKEQQLSFFDNSIDEEKQRKAEVAIDDIRRRFGHQAIMRSIMLCDKDLVDCNPKADNIIGPISYFR